MVLARSEPTD